MREITKLDVNDVHDKVSSLMGYLKMWNDGKIPPQEIPELIEEVEEWLNSLKP